MATLIDDFARQRPDSVERRGGESFVAVEAAVELLNQAEAKGYKILGLEGFVVSDDAVYPALSRIAVFSSELTSAEAASKARALLQGPWRTAPRGFEDQIHSEATGRHMVTVVIVDSA